VKASPSFGASGDVFGSYTSPKLSPKPPPLTPSPSRLSPLRAKPIPKAAYGRLSETPAVSKHAETSQDRKNAPSQGNVAFDNEVMQDVYEACFEAGCYVVPTVINQARLEKDSSAAGKLADFIAKHFKAQDGRSEWQFSPDDLKELDGKLREDAQQSAKPENS